MCIVCILRAQQQRDSALKEMPHTGKGVLIHKMFVFPKNFDLDSNRTKNSKLLFVAKFSSFRVLGSIKMAIGIEHNV